MSWPRVSGCAASRLETPLEPAPALAAASGAAEVRLKLEALQPTGSFKIRGAHNKLSILAAARAAGNEPSLPVVTASSGQPWNRDAHARPAIRHDRHDPRGTMTSRPPSWSGCARSRPTQSRLSSPGRDYDEAEAEARRREQLGAAVYAAPYNDPDVIAGQGTIGLEVMEAWPECDAILHR